VNSWQALDDELDLWRESGGRAELWCRDDDACRDSPALRRLLEVAANAEIPVALAVIPALIEQSLVDSVEKAPRVTILQHGYAHRNHAPPGERNWELGGHRPVDEVVAELKAGRNELARRFGRRFLRCSFRLGTESTPGSSPGFPEAGFTDGRRSARETPPRRRLCSAIPTWI
jgi:hypothetical protein